MSLAMLFYNPITLPSWSQLPLVIPLCLAVAIIYKTIRINQLRRLPLEILALFLYILCGLAALCGALWLIHKYWV